MLGRYRTDRIMPGVHQSQKGYFGSKGMFRTILDWQKKKKKVM